MTENKQPEKSRAEQKRRLPIQLGKYRVLEELGRGGMAIVYRCEDTETGQVVAAKALLPELVAQPAFVKRFRREIETHRNLDHPNIVKILDVGEETNLQYYVMEFMNGPTVEKQLRLMGKFAVKDAAKVTRAIANALQYAHGRGVIHRDIKPANIMTDSEGNVKLADFGIAKDADATRLTVTGGIVGTADYMSPEQAEGRRVTRKSDIYSVGVCLYQMLTGRLPFVGKTYLDVIRAHRFSLPESPRALNPSIPGPVARLVESMMEKDPEKRPASAADVLAKLDQIESPHNELTEEERESAGEMVREALFPAATAREIALKVVAVVAAIVVLAFVADGIRYRYFTTAEYKYSMGMETFRARDYHKALAYFDETIYFHPGSEYVKPAQERIQEILYILRNQDPPPNKPRMEPPKGTYLYEQAVAMLKAGNSSDAIEFLQNLVKDMPGTDNGKLAAAKLVELSGGKRTAPLTIGSSAASVESSK